jgi:hypothetical protein
VVEFVDESDQTVTHWGLDGDSLRQLASAAGMRGLDRLVPISPRRIGPVYRRFLL